VGYLLLLVSLLLLVAARCWRAPRGGRARACTPSPPLRAGAAGRASASVRARRAPRARCAPAAQRLDAGVGDEAGEV